MRTRLWAGAGALVLTTTALTTMGGPVSAATPSAPPVVTIAMTGAQVTISQATMRPGVVEFHVGKTIVIPGDQGGPDTLSIIRTDHLDQLVAAVPVLFGDPTDPAAAAAAVSAIKTIHAIGTVYGGGNKGTVWQVNLPAGNYYAIAVNATAMGLAKPVGFTVAGTPRNAVLHATQAAVRAVGTVGHNRWEFDQPGGRAVSWLRFTNKSHELHFLDMAGVDPSTTNAMVKKALNSPAEPKFFTGPNLNFDVLSPGVTVAIQAAMPAGTYLLTCFMPSEGDGMPHAMMGMYKLVDVK